MRYFVPGIALIILLLATACQSEPEGTTIEGQIEQAENLSAYFDKIAVGQANNILERTELGSDGSFQFAFPEGLQPGVYQIRIGAKRLQMILNGAEQRIRLKGSLEDFDGYQVEVEGSPYTQQFAAMLRGFVDKDYGLEDLQTFVDTVQNGLLAAHMTVTVLGPSMEQAELHRKAYDKLFAQYPNAPMTTGYGKFIDQLEAEYARYMANQRVQIGQPAPELELPGPEGKTYRLSDLRGQLVLLDFWASWCMPCRQENPNVVQVYNKYKDQGFTIFSVSLDGVNDRTRQRITNEDQLEQLLERHRDRWVQAIEDDRLTWPYHVSDLKQWNSSAAATYGVNAIPRTFFIDRDGKIAAVNLRGARQIERVIQQHL